MSAGAQAAPVEEIRMAVVLNGGVSLAVWMGGVVQELNRLTWADPSATQVRCGYASALNAVRSTARADVIAGTSAGGINGAALALGQVNAVAQPARLRDLWVEQGDIDALLRRPFRGQPTSLLQGDEFFLQQLEIAMAALSSTFTPTGRPVDLTLATTLIDGVQTVTVDVLGQRIPDTAYDGRFHFSAAQLGSAGVGRALALAARCSAGFPVAFEPCFVPVGVATDRLDGRADMTRYASWAEAGRAGPVDRSRFTVDGGLLANTPTRSALGAIARMPPADGPTRRVMLLVHPHAPVEAPETAACRTAPPTVVDTLGGLLTALTGQGSRNFAEEIDRHNRNAAAWRDGRSDVLAALNGPESLHTLVDQLWPHYRRMRIRQLRSEWVAHAPTPPLWSAQRIRSAITTAFEAWEGDPGGALPFLPAVPPVPGPGWPWGFGTAIAVVDEVGDLARRALGVARDVTAVALIYEVQTAVVAARGAIAQTQDGFWASLSARGADPTADFWTSVLRGLATDLAGSVGDTVRSHVDAVLTALHAALPPLYDLIRDERCGPQAGLEGWDVLLAGAPERPELLVRLLQLEVATAMVTDADRLRSTQPIDLVQLSLRAANWFAVQTAGGGGKLAGLALHRFGGFLKRSWRVNDWIWGRLDAATVLTRIVLSPERLLRIQAVTGSADGAEAIVQTITERLYGTEDTPAMIAKLRDAALTELTDMFRPGADAPPSLPKLADYIAARLHVDIALAELPLLAAAIRADRVAGAGPRSRGEVFLEVNKGLLEELDRGVPDERRLLVGVRALEAFDAAGIGRESLEQEATSDQLIRTTATAAAMTSTLLDSDGSGLGGTAKPVTRTLRGAMLLPYWVITGLTAGGATARVLAFAGLTVGGVLLTLSLLGLLGSASSAGALLGVGAVLCALAYSAMRSGTLLHGLVLLLPVAPLVAVGLSGVLGSTKEATAEAAATVGIVLALVLALIVLASLPSPVLSPFKTVQGWWRRVGEHGAGPALTAPARRARAAFRVLGVLVPTAGVAAIAWAAVRSGGLGPRPPLWLLAAGLGLVATFGTVIASVTGAWLRLWTPVPATDGTRTWTRRAVNHPAGVSAGWSVVYGVLYGGLALAVAAFAPPDSTLWTGFAVGSAVIAGMLCAVAPFWFPLRARRGLDRRITTDTDLITRLGPMVTAAEVAEATAAAARTAAAKIAAAASAEPTGHARADEVRAAEAEAAARDGQARDARQKALEAARAELRSYLDRRGAIYDYLTDELDQDGTPKLSPVGEDLAAALCDRDPFPRVPLPVSVHLTAAGTALLAVALVPLLGLRLDIGVGMAVGVTAVGAVVALAAGGLEGSRLRSTSGLPGLGSAVLGGLGSVVAAFALAASSSRWVLLGAAVGVLTVAAQLWVAAAARRHGRRLEHLRSRLPGRRVAAPAEPSTSAAVAQPQPTGRS